MFACEALADVHYVTPGLRFLYQVSVIRTHFTAKILSAG